MGSEWEKVEITATTKQTKSAEQVEAEYVAKQWADLRKEAEAADARSKAALAVSANSMGVVGLNKFLGIDKTGAGSGKIDVGAKSLLDNAAGAKSPIVNSAEQQLRSLAGGGYAASFGNVGNLMSSPAGKALAGMLPTNLATSMNKIMAGGLGPAKDLMSGGLSGLTSNVKGLLGGGTGGSFNPIGLVLGDEIKPSGADFIKLAKPVFTSGTTLQGETVDIYDKSLQSPQNKVKSILSDVLSAANESVLGSISKNLLKAAGNSANISNMLGEVNLDTAKGVLNKFKNTLLSGVPLTKDGMLKDLYSAVGYDGKSLEFRGGLKGIGESMMKDITKNIDGQTGLVTLYKDVKKVLDGDYDTAETLFKIVDNFTGSNAAFAGLIDYTNEFKIISNVSKALIQMGAIDELDRVIEKIDHKDRDKFIEDNLSTGLQTGDVNFLKFALRKSSGPKILASYPDAVSMVVGSFTPKVDVGDNVLASEYTDLVSCLSQLTPDWDSAGIVNGKKVMDLGVFSKFNQQAKLAILAAGNREHIAALIAAENYGAVYDILPQLQVRYPEYPII